jgi:phosphatidate cytidylyltransferase
MALRPARAFDPALGERVISSLVLATGAIVAVLVGGWLFILVALVAIVIMAGEWTRLLDDADVTARSLVLGSSALLPIAAVLVTARGRPDLGLATLLVGAALAAATAALVPGAPPDRAAGGAIYVGTPAVALVWLRNVVPGGLELVLWLLIVVWATDICAYFVGRTVGGPKLAPRISPSKTWAGLVGGMAGAALFGGLMALAMSAGFLRAALLGAALALVAQAGDLFESVLKRRSGYKDSGHLIPGHGGLLDRIDGLVFAAPCFAAIVGVHLAGAAA